MATKDSNSKWFSWWIRLSKLIFSSNLDFVMQTRYVKDWSQRIDLEAPWTRARSAFEGCESKSSKTAVVKVKSKDVMGTHLSQAETKHCRRFWLVQPCQGIDVGVCRFHFVVDIVLSYFFSEYQWIQRLWISWRAKLDLSNSCKTVLL